MRPGAHLLDPLDDGLDLFLRRRRLHHDHHQSVLLVFTRRWTLYVRRALGRPAAGRFFTAERLEKSPGDVRVATTRGTGEAGEIGTGGVGAAVSHGREEAVLP